ncbi:MAG: Clp protease N-terminal domain-containing protein [Acidimicrobiales bacterium]
MFERFSSEARAVVVAAERHANSLGQSVRPEHLLLGILDQTNSVAVRTLVGTSVDVDGVRRELSPPGRSESNAGTRRPFTPEARKTLELSLREALDAGDDRISTEHVLLGLLREPAGAAAQVLARHGGDLDRIRVAVRSGNRSFVFDIATTMQGQLDRLEREVTRLAEIVDRLGAADEQAPLPQRE